MFGNNWNPVTSKQFRGSMKDDPRYILAMQALEQGTSGEPVPNVYAGIARALQGALGGYMANREGRRFRDRQDIYAKDLGKSELPMQSQSRIPQGDLVPDQRFGDNPPIPMWGGGGNVNPNSFTPPDPMQHMQEANARRATGIGPGVNDIARILGGRPPGNPIQPQVDLPLGANNRSRVLAAPSPARLDNITAQTESRNRDFDARGRPVRSPAGAMYAMQVMPATARDPGFGLKSANTGNPADMNRLGREYRAKMQQRYGGDLSKMWAAYNAGPGAVDEAIAKGGRNWLKFVLPETQAYVRKNMSSIGGSAVEQGAVEASDNAAPRFDVPDLPVAPEKPIAPEIEAAVRSEKMALARRLLATGNSDFVDEIMGLLKEGAGEQTQANENRAGRVFDQGNQAFGRAEQDYYGARDDLRGSQFREREAITAANRGAAGAEWEQRNKIEDREDRQRHESAENALERAGEGAPSLPEYAMFGNANGKPLPEGRRKAFTGNVIIARKMDSVFNRFQDNFAGSGANFIGDMEHWASERTGYRGGEVQWWKDYNEFIVGIRHDKFGSTLTEGEKQAFDKIIIHPSTAPDIAKQYLQQQRDILMGALRREAHANGAAGFNAGEIYETIGSDFVSRMSEWEQDFNSRQNNSSGQIMNGVPFTLGGKQYKRYPDGRITEVVK